MKLLALETQYYEQRLAVESLQEINNYAIERINAANPLSEVVNLGIYYYNSYKIFGREQDLAHAQTLFAKINNHSNFFSQAAWSTESLETLAGIAQLACWLLDDVLISRPAAELFVAADSQLLLQIQDLLFSRQAISRAIFFRIIRYFQIRLSARGIADGLHMLLQRAQAAYDRQEWTLLLPTSGEVASTPTPLGLGDGLAGEARQLIRLYKAGIRQPILLEAIQARIITILATRREVDFSEDIYNLFPNNIPSGTDNEQAGQELTWRRGDLGQALLLYEAGQLLQDQELIGLAELTGLNTLLRRTEDNTAVFTSDFYEGAAGTAHLYYQLWQHSGHLAYEAGYHYWLQQTHRLLAQDQIRGLYQQQRGLHQDITIVGLVLLSAFATPTVQWEQRLG